jgi:Mg-chelatase subunit ChlI
MQQNPSDPVMDEIREIRQRISERFDHDPEKLVEYYQGFQQQYKDRLIDTAKGSEQVHPTAA